MFFFPFSLNRNHLARHTTAELPLSPGFLSLLPTISLLRAIMYINYIQNKIQVLMCSRYIVDTVSRKMVALTKIPRLLLIEETRRRLTISIVRSVMYYPFAFYSTATLRRYFVRKISQRSIERRLSSLENSALTRENRRG